MDMEKIMGTDIHMRIEHKTKNGWRFYSYSNDPLDIIYLKRDYTLFDILANGARRKDVWKLNSIDSPRGWPNDCDSETLSGDFEDKDHYHSHSWVLISEVLDFFNVSNSAFKWKNKKEELEDRIELIKFIDLEWLYNILRENIDPDMRNIR